MCQSESGLSSSQISKIDAFANQGEQPDTVVGDIELENVTFTYPARPEAPVSL